MSELWLLSEAQKGFIVVANEVRALAQRSSEAVTAIQKLMAKSGDIIANGTRQVVLSSNALQEMIEIMDRVGVRVGDLAASSEVQAANVNEVNTAVADLERNTQQNAAMAEELSAASELLKTAVTALTEQTAFFVRSESSESIQSNVRHLN